MRLLLLSVLLTVSVLAQAPPTVVVTKTATAQSAVSAAKCVINLTSSSTSFTWTCTAAAGNTTGTYTQGTVNASQIMNADDLFCLAVVNNTTATWGIFPNTATPPAMTYQVPAHSVALSCSSLSAAVTLTL